MCIYIVTIIGMSIYLLIIKLFINASSPDIWPCLFSSACQSHRLSLVGLAC